MSRHPAGRGDWVSLSLYVQKNIVFPLPQPALYQSPADASSNQEALAGTAGVVLSSPNRALQDVAGPTPVATPEELKNAILIGASDILITAHLDLTVLEAQNTTICPDGCAGPLPEISKTRSIRGNCAAPTAADMKILKRTPGATALVPVQPQQCLIFTNEDTLQIQVSRIWIDNLYLRAVFVNNPENRVRDGISIGLLAVATMEDGTQYQERGIAKRYVTRTTMQGDGLGPTVPIWINEDTYVENCTFVNAGGNGLKNCQECSSAVNVQRGASVAIFNSTFYDNVPGNVSRYVRTWENATAVMLSGCKFGNHSQPFEQHDDSRFYSDNMSLVIEASGGEIVAPFPLSAIPDADPPEFLSRNDKWFVDMVEELTGEQGLLLQTTYAAPPPVAPLPQLPPPSDEEVPTSAIVAAAVAAAIGLLVGFCLFHFWREKRHQHHPGAESTLAGEQKGESIHAPSQAALSHTRFCGMLKVAEPINSPLATTCTTNAAPSSISRKSRSLRVASYTTLNNFNRSSTAGGEMTTFFNGEDTTLSEVDGPKPPDNAPVNVKLNFLHGQLNALGRDTVLLQRFALLGPLQRRQGGQGVVAFARGIHDDLGYAMKFFAQRSSFLAERDMYRLQALGSLLPKVYAEYDPEESPHSLLDPKGRPLPPCIVMERGEGLSDWSQRAEPDIFQSVAVLAHVATRLRDLHRAGYVHRDIKPENIMLLPRENVWTVIDLGCTVRAGEAARLSYTLVYAAPEVAEAAATGQKTIVADPAIDAWSLGIVAFELLTRQSAFNLVIEGKDSVLAKLRGQEELPWEGDLNAKDPLARQRLGLFREPVLGLLHHDPAQRSSLADFCKTTNTVFSSRTTTHKDAD